MRHWMTMGVVATLWLGPLTGTAEALTIKAPPSNDDYWVFVAMVGLNAFGLKSAVACWEKKSDRSSGHYATLGFLGLDDDYQIHGDASSGGAGSDDMRVGWPSNLPSNSYCKGIVVSGTADLVYDGHYLDLYGGGGNDSSIWDGGGSNNTWVNGGAGDDFVQQSSSVGRAHGDGGNGTVWGLDGSGDALYGDGGADCLWDLNNSFAEYSCGGDAGDTRDHGRASRRPGSAARRRPGSSGERHRRT